MYCCVGMVESSFTFADWVHKNADGLDEKLAVVPVGENVSPVGMKNSFGMYDRWNKGNEWDDFYRDICQKKMCVLKIPVGENGFVSQPNKNGEISFKWFVVEMFNSEERFFVGKEVEKGLFHLDDSFCNAFRGVWNVLPFGEMVKDEYRQFVEVAKTKENSGYLTPVALKQIALRAY